MRGLYPGDHAMPAETAAYPCPHCHRADLEAVASVPYVRGFLVAYQIGSKRFVGCVGCVRGQVFKEVGLSALIGWFSITALVINPFLLIYGLIRGATVGADPEAVRKMLREAGMPEQPTHVDPLQVAYALAAAMIAADGQVDDEELAVAEQIGRKLFPEFDGEVLADTVARHRELPSVGELAGLMGEMMTEKGKVLLYRYLEAIAHADGILAQEEEELLFAVQRKLKLPDELVAPPPEAEAA